MAIGPRDVPISRSDVQGWLNIYKQAPSGSVGTLRDYLCNRIAAKKVDDTTVTTTEVEGFGDTTELVDLIMADLESYGYSG